jgi:hypothetical protein
MPKRPIYTWPQSDFGQHYHLAPQVDPLGEWAAWSPRGAGGVEIHSLRDHSNTPPSVISGPFSTYSMFCDWTEDGQLLVNTHSVGRTELVVLAKDGTLVRRVPTDTRPAVGSIAACRKWGHR